MRLLVIEARFYDEIADALLAGAHEAIVAAGASHDLVTVPGALEIGPALAMAVDAALFETRYDGVVALGCVIRGETTHYETVAQESARGLHEIAMAHGLAVGNGILTVENMNQAHARAQPGESDKGGDAVRACLALIAVRQRFAGLADG